MLQLNPDSGRYETPYKGLDFPSLGEAIVSVDAQAVEAMLLEHPAGEVLDPDFWRNILDEQIARVDFR